jgi:pantoate--beta-alanine ligase
MRVITDIRAMQAEADRARRTGLRLALVPTMGSLHEGHLELVRHAKRAGNHITVSIFVNPTQFKPGEDYDRYPRNLPADLDRLSEVGEVDVVYAPPPEAMYAGGEAGLTWVTVDRLSEHLCGPYRGGHFRGVTTVVTKLFNACRPHAAVFGLKDAQQFFILSRMVQELDFGIEMVGVDTVREESGLAMSSRNRYLSPEGRAQAVALSQAVFGARDSILKGEKDAGAILDLMRAAFRTAPLVALEYAELVDAAFLQPLSRLDPGSTVVAATAAHVDGGRLIDNAIVQVPQEPSLS